jgi:mannosylglycerate synthase
VSLVVFPFKDEPLDVIASNMTTAARHDRVDEVWAVSAAEGTALAGVSRAGGEIEAMEGTSMLVFPQERLGSVRSGKGDGMNTALTRAAERGHSRVHFYDADITNFDDSWIDGAEHAADRGYGVVRHRFPRAATDAMITWMVTRPGLAMLFPGSLLPRLGQPLGGELLLTRPAVESLASDPFVLARSDWGIDTVITHATAVMGLGIYEHNAPDGKRHALYGSLTDIRDMVLECLDAVASLRGRRSPHPGSRFETDPPAPVPGDLKETVAYDVGATRRSIASPPGPGEQELLHRLGMDPARPHAMDADGWMGVFPSLLESFALDDDDWRNVAFRLWVERVIDYTTTQVPLGYDHAMEYLEATIVAFERAPSPWRSRRARPGSRPVPPPDAPEAVPRSPSGP